MSLVFVKSFACSGLHTWYIYSWYVRSAAHACNDAPSIVFRVVRSTRLHWLGGHVVASSPQGYVLCAECCLGLLLSLADEVTIMALIQSPVLPLWYPHLVQLILDYVLGFKCPANIKSPAVSLTQPGLVRWHMNLNAVGIAT